MRSKFFVVIGVLMIASMIITACQPAPAAEPETITIIETVIVEKEGETIVEEVERVVTATAAPMEEVTFASKDPTIWVDVTFGDVDTLDVGYAYDSASGDLLYNVYDALVWYNNMDAGTFVPMLAESWDIEDEGETYIFHIREGVQFHDGSPLLPSDVAYTFVRNLLQGGMDSPQFLLTEPFLGVGVMDITEIVHGLAYPDPDEAAEVDVPYDDAETLATFDPAAISGACELVKSIIVADNDAMTVTFNLAQLGWRLHHLAAVLCLAVRRPQPIWCG